MRKHTAPRTPRFVTHSWDGTPNLAASWISTETIRETDIAQAHGLWVAPGSPYKNLERTLEAIRMARERLVPCLGTCGGFQHIILEFARNVLGFADASHAEYDPGASRLFVNTLSCSVKGMELRVTLRPQTIARRLYGREEAIERYYCTFGVNPEYAETLADHRDLVISGRDLGGEIRIVEILSHPFFLGTLFVPQAQSTEGKPHPLVSGFLQAVIRHRDLFLAKC